MIATAFTMHLMNRSDGLWKDSDRKTLQEQYQGDCSVSGTRDPVVLINFSASTLYGNRESTNGKYILSFVYFILFYFTCLNIITGGQYFSLYNSVGIFPMDFPKMKLFSWVFKFLL